MVDTYRKTTKWRTDHKDTTLPWVGDHCDQIGDVIRLIWPDVEVWRSVPDGAEDLAGVDWWLQRPDGNGRANIAARIHGNHWLYRWDHDGSVALRDKEWVRLMADSKEAAGKEHGFFVFGFLNKTNDGYADAVALNLTALRVRHKVNRLVHFVGDNGPTDSRYVRIPLSQFKKEPRTAVVVWRMTEVVF